MRDIKYIVVHCTATDPKATVSDIKKFWKEERKWDKPGYHYLILRDGDVERLLADTEISYGAHGHNQECIHLAYIGGIDKAGQPIDNRSTSQKHSMFDLIVKLSEKYPQAKIMGHRDFPDVHKACPCFDVKEWLANYEPDLTPAA